MGIPIGELQERISSRQFAEYWAFFELEPWGPERDDLRSGIVAATIANANRDPKKRAKPYAAEDFVPRVGRPSAEEEVEGPDPTELGRKIAETMSSIAQRRTGEIIREPR